MKKISKFAGAMIFATVFFASCGGPSFCDCMTDANADQAACDELAKGMSTSELLEEMGKCAE